MDQSFLFRTLKLFILTWGVLICLDGLFLIRAARQSDLKPVAEQAARLFVEKIEPALAAKCQTCHGADGASGLDLRSRESLLKGGRRGPGLGPGNAEKSPLYLALLGQGGFKQMPPGKPLASDLIAAFKQWIDAGAPWVEKREGPIAPDAEAKWRSAEGDVWAFKPVKRFPIPTISDSRHAQTPVDAFVLQKLSEKGIKPAPPADRVTLVRRATFDLHGLPPTPEEVEAFVKDPLPVAKAFEKVVERLLGSPRYGERWGRHWLDVVRYADTGGGSNDYERPHAWRYRDYVIRSFNQDKPYDRFIHEQLAGDELDPNNPEYLVATGFLRMGPWEHTSMSVEAVTRQEWLDDVTHNTATAFLGLTMNCAKCHDHKFDPIPTRDYYRWQAVFATTRFDERHAPFLPEENPSQAALSQARLQPRFDRTQEKYNQIALALGKKPRTQVSNQTNAANNAATPAQVQSTPLKELKDVGVDPQRVELLELERAYLKRVEFGRLALKRLDPMAFSVSCGDPTKAERPEETRILIGGNLHSPGPQVSPGVLGFIVPPSGGIIPAEAGTTNSNSIPNTAAGRRLALAKWIASSSNPLTARVMVNRIWQYHFGKGIVETSNNFGKLGKRPSHSELLDWLASYFVERGWSVKAMHRLLMNSAAYQRASRFQAGAQPDFVAKADPENRLLARFPPRRMEAEELRDSMLMAAGELNTEMGGPGSFPELNADLVAQPRLIMGTVAPVWEASPTRAERNRRTIYTFQKRSIVAPVVEVFNGANMNESCEFRRASTIAPQVFSLFNSQFAYDTALAFARRLERASSESRKQIDLAFRLAYQRPPSAMEREKVLAHLKAMTEHHRAVKPPPPVPFRPVEQAVASEYSGLTFRFVEDTDFTDYERSLHPAEVSAKTRALAEVCLVLLNANEFVYIY